MILRPYQEVGRDFLASRHVALLADEMRVGKTPQAILAAHKVGAERVLVVCPAIAVEHWRREWDKWGYGGLLSRVTVFSYDGARRDAALLSQRWDLLIVDECHFAKNPEAQRTKLIYGKGGLAWRSARTWALSGTPAPKHAAELWPMLRAFGVVGMTYSEFVQRYCVVDWQGTIRGTRMEMVDELRGLLGKVMLRRLRRDVAPEMPAIDYQFIEVEKVGGVDLRPPIHDQNFDLWIDAHNAGTWDVQDRIAVANAKAPQLVDNVAFAIENGLLKQAVVFGWHVEPLERVVAQLQRAGIRTALLNGSTSPRRRVEIQDDFRHGKIQVVVANILAAGTAIDLSAASHAYFLELDWVPANNVQAANRLVSMQKAEGVTVDVLTWPGSVDDRVQKALMRRVRELSKLY